MVNEPDIIDLRQVSCGLIPAMTQKLLESGADVVEFHIKQGMRTELVATFGTDPDWEMVHQSHIGMDLARFTRRIPASDASELNIVDY